MIGYPISVAVAPCDAGSRDSTSLLFGAETREAVKDLVVATPLTSDLPRKTTTFTAGIWE